MQCRQPNAAAAAGASSVRVQHAASARLHPWPAVSQSANELNQL